MPGLERIEKLLGVNPEQIGYAFNRPPLETYPHVKASEREAFWGPFMLRAWLRDLVSPRRTGEALGTHLWERYRYSDSSKHLTQHAFEAIDLAGRMRRADWRTNGLVASLLENPQKEQEASNFGELIFMAHETPGLPHNIDHLRRVELFVEAYVYMEPGLRHGEAALHDVLDGVMLSVKTHDWHQAVWEFRNKFKESNQPTKEGHAPLDSTYLSALQPEYQFEAQVDKWDAQRAVAIGALMNLVHNEPEKLAARFSASGQACDFLTINNELVFPDDEINNFLDAWKNCQINPFSMTRAHIMVLGREELKRAGFNFGESVWGMDVAFEQERATFLEYMSQDRKTFFELIKPPNEAFISAIINGAEVIARADVVDMNIAPEAIVRMLQVPISAKRPWFNGEVGEDQLTDKQKVQIATELKEYEKGLGNDLSERERILKLKAWELVLKFEAMPGNWFGEFITLDSDVRRFLWQLLNQESGSRESAVGRGVFVQRFEDIINLQALLVFGEVGKRLMAADIGVIDAIFNRREQELTSKYQEKKSPLLGSKWALTIISRLVKGDVGAGMIVQAETQDMVSKRQIFEAKLKAMRAEYLQVLNHLKIKPDGTDGEIKVYSDEQITLFEAVIRAAVERFTNKRGIDPKVVDQAGKLAKSWSRPAGMPYGAYQSLASALKARTWIARSPFVNDRINELELIIYGESS